MYVEPGDCEFVVGGFKDDTAGDCATTVDGNPSTLGLDGGTT